LSTFSYAHDVNGGISGAILAEGGNLFGPSTSTNTLYRDAWLWHQNRWTELTAPWSGTPVRFPNSGNPPAGPQPLLGALAAEPAYCNLTYLGTVITANSPFAVASKTFIASLPRGNANPPTTCLTPKTTTLKKSSAAATAPPTPSTAAGAADLADTGTQHAGWLVIVALLLLAAGGLTMTVARTNVANPGPRHKR
jgi:LPXTG-motif cell wall-anchored protein